MEEVDEIVLHSLRELGCDLDEDVKSIRQLNADNVYQAILLSLGAIDEQYSSKFPETMPLNISTRVNICTELAQTIKEIGYRGEIGFEKILYHQAIETRKLLLWLDEQRQKAPDAEDSKKKDADFIGTAVLEELARLQKETWTPTFTNPPYSKFSYVWTLSTTPIRSPLVLAPNSKNKALETYIRNHLKHVTQQQVKRQDVVPSILEHNRMLFTEAQERDNEWNTYGLESGLEVGEYRKRKKDNVAKSMSTFIRSALGAEGGGVFGSYMTFVQDLVASEDGRRKKSKAAIILKGTRFTRQVDFRENADVVVKSIVPEESEDELQAKREKEIAELDDKIANSTNELQTLQKELETFASTLRQIEASMIAEQRKKETLEEEYKVKKRTNDLLGDAENNIRTLRDLSQQAAQRLKDLASEWEKRRKPLIDTYRKLRSSNEKAEKTKDIVAKIKAMREEMKELAGEIQKKDERQRQLVEIFNRLNKDMLRYVYTRRILEIVKNVKKQKVDIDKILIDTRNLKKEISSIYDTLSRSFAITSELIFQDALKDPVAKQAYKDLAAMDGKFKSLAERVEETGNIKNSILDLEVKIEQVAIRTESLDFDRLNEDLQRIKSDNQSLIAKIKGSS